MGSEQQSKRPVDHSTRGLRGGGGGGGDGEPLEVFVSFCSSGGYISGRKKKNESNQSVLCFVDILS